LPILPFKINLAADQMVDGLLPRVGLSGFESRDCAGGQSDGSPPNEAIYDCVARCRRLARQRWKIPPLGCLPEDSRQSEERGLSRRLAPLAASLD
jgi:hypothetical protein